MTHSSEQCLTFSASKVHLPPVLRVNVFLPYPVAGMRFGSPDLPEDHTPPIFVAVGIQAV